MWCYAQVRILDTDVVANMGIYTFSMRASGTKVQARYSYTYKKQVDGRWLITEHHSSGMPEGITDEILAAFNQWADTLKTLDPLKVRGGGGRKETWWMGGGGRGSGGEREARACTRLQSACMGHIRRPL